MNINTFLAAHTMYGLVTHIAVSIVCSCHRNHAAT
jgi:hypothetical protein